MSSSILPPSIDPQTKILTLLAHASLGRRLLPTNWVEPIDGVMRCSCMLRESATDTRVCSRNKPGKHPRISQWQTRASCDEQQILEWHQWLPKANWGWVQDDTFALDVDPKRGGLDSLTQWEDNAGGPAPTLRQSTPSGGCHLIYAQPGVGDEGRISVQGDVLPGIEIRGCGSYIMVDPSRGCDGVWSLLNPSTLPAEADDFTLALIHKHGIVLGDFGDGIEILSGNGANGGKGKKKKKSTGKASDLPSTGWFIKNGFGGYSGSRNTDAYRLAWRLFRTCAHDKEVATIMKMCWAATEQGSDPFPWDECLGAVNSAWVRMKRQDEESAKELRARAASLRNTVTDTPAMWKAYVKPRAGAV